MNRHGESLNKTHEYGPENSLEAPRPSEKSLPGRDHPPEDALRPHTHPFALPGTPSPSTPKR